MNTLATNALLLAMGVGVLYFGAEWLVRGATPWVCLRSSSV